MQRRPTIRTENDNFVLETPRNRNITLNPGPGGFVRIGNTIISGDTVVSSPTFFRVFVFTLFLFPFLIDAVSRCYRVTTPVILSLPELDHRYHQATPKSTVRGHFGVSHPPLHQHDDLNCDFGHIFLVDEDLALSVP